MENENAEVTDEMKCIKCGRSFEKDDIDYLTFEGNVYVGEDDGIIGNNMPLISGTNEEADLFRRSDIRKQRICLSCFIKDIEQLRLDTINELSIHAIDLADKIKVLADKTDIDIPEFLKKR